ncbi:MAG: hypothetical protein ACLPY1_20140 [Terracidiphilus sp.]
MPRKSFLCAALFAAILLAHPASQTAQDTSPTSRVPSVNGISIPDTPGAPFSATVVLEFERIWPDGSSEIRRTINLIARDSQGRTHNEVRRLMPQYFHGSPELMSVRLFDPLTRIRTIYEPALHVAREQFVPKKPKTTTPPNPSVHIEDLGTTTLNGLQARGTRRTRTITDYEWEINEPVKIEDETWYSEELHLDLLTRHSDSRFGVETVGVSDLKRIEPPASMFQVPPGYRILYVSPPPASASPSTPKPSSDASEFEPPS